MCVGLAAGGSRSAVDTLDQAVIGEPFQIPVHRDRGDAVVAGELSDRGASVALNSLEDLGSANVGGHRGQEVESEAETRVR